VDGFEKSVAGSENKLSMLQQKLQHQQKAVQQYEKALAAAEKKLQTGYDKQGKLTRPLETAKQKNDELKDKVAAATEQYERFRRELGGNDSATIAAKENLEALKQEYAASSQEVKKLEGQLTANAKAMQNNADAVTRANTNLNNASAALRQTESEIHATTEKLARMRSAWTQAGETLTAFGTKCAAVAKAMEKTGKVMTATVSAPILALGSASLKAAIEFESAFTGVRKTVDATEEEYAQLAGTIRQMSTEIATSTTDIASVMEGAGQLGIAKENLVDFTRTMIDLGNSTDISADDAATAIAQFANVSGMAQSEFSNFGSTLVDLGNNFATTESNIMNMGTALASAGAQVGLSESQILGFATALSSVGLEAQAGGTAFSKATIQMQVAVETGNDSLKDFAKVSGMSTDAFKELWKSDPSAAIQSFIVGLSKMDEQGISDRHVGGDGLQRSASARHAAARYERYRLVQERTAHGCERVEEEHCPFGRSR
jgi:phage-related tail protein